MAKMQIKLKPFSVPNFACIEHQSNPSFPIEQIDHDALDELAGQWLDELYAKQGRRSPFFTASAA